MNTTQISNKSAQTDNRKSPSIRRETIATIAVFAASLALLLTARLISPSFNSLSQVLTVLVLASFLIVVAFGQGLVVLIGGLDLSIPSVITLGGILSSGWIGTADPGMQMVMFIPALMACALVGAVSGFGITILKIPAFIMTLAIGVIVYSGCLGFTKGSPTGTAPKLMYILMKSESGSFSLALVFVVIFVACALIIQRKSIFGLHLYAIGSNSAAARVAGLRVNILTIATYAISAACAGWVGMMLVGYSNGATLRMGESYLLPSIAAVVIGGSSIFGGRGSYLGTVGGALLLTILSMIITTLGMPHGWRTVIEGSVILLALLLLQDQFMDSIRKMLRR